MSHLTNSEVDDLIAWQYEEALSEEEGWAIEAYVYRQGVKDASPTVDPS